LFLHFLLLPVIVTLRESLVGQVLVKTGMNVTGWHTENISKTRINNENSAHGRNVIARREFKGYQEMECRQNSDDFRHKINNSAKY
jgi:hypothetical protein